jgi:hypothetical protein
MTPCSLVEVSDVLLERSSSIHGVKSLASKQAESTLLAGLLGLLFFPEDAGGIFLRNVSKLPDYTVLHPGR